MQAIPFSTYALKDLHQAIDLIDRKINYCKTWESFDSQEARESNLRKLSTKRETLVKSARALAASGVTCDPAFLPRSFMEPVAVAAEAEAIVPAAAGNGKVVRAKRARR